MPSFVALLKISGRVEGAKQRLQKLPQRWLGCTTEKVIFGTGGYDAVVVFVAPDIVEANPKGPHLPTDTICSGELNGPRFVLASEQRSLQSTCNVVA